MYICGGNVQSLQFSFWFDIIDLLIEVCVGVGVCVGVCVDVGEWLWWGCVGVCYGYIYYYSSCLHSHQIFTIDPMNAKFTQIIA